MGIFIEKLPARKSSRNTTITFRIATDNAFSQVAGLLRIDTDRSSASYTVAEFVCQWGGRAFYIAKVSGGTDNESESYSVFCSKNGPESDSCDCKGSTRFGHCKHRDSIRVLVSAGVL